MLVQRKLPPLRGRPTRRTKNGCLSQANRLPQRRQLGPLLQLRRVIYDATCAASIACTERATPSGLCSACHQLLRSPSRFLMFPMTLRLPRLHVSIPSLHPLQLPPSSSLTLCWGSCGWCVSLLFSTTHAFDTQSTLCCRYAKGGDGSPRICCLSFLVLDLSCHLLVLLYTGYERHHCFKTTLAKLANHDA